LFAKGIYLNIDLFSRFWPSEISFNNNSLGFLIENNSEVVSVCYSCGMYNNIHEIDVFTKETHRDKGLAKIICANFIDYCFKNKLIPNWDCFINNTGSIELSKSLGYEKILEPYKFYTYKRIF
jgi:RimJ/RimL family protein N-acetyltransferase